MSILYICSTNRTNTKSRSNTFTLYFINLTFLKSKMTLWVKTLGTVVSSLSCPHCVRDLSVRPYQHCSVVTESSTEIKLTQQWFDADHHDLQPNCSTSSSPRLNMDHTDWMDSVTSSNAKPLSSVTVTLHCIFDVSRTLLPENILF